VLALSPATVSPTVTAQEWVVLAVGIGLVIAVNVVLLRRVFGPLERLEATMERVDPLDPGRRIAVGADDEIARLEKAFNAMLDRLEHERADSGRRALRAQEAERARLARELHDELGQLLTGVVLQLEGLGAAVAPRRRADVTEIQDTVREGVQAVREIAQGLRPPALDEFGLRASLVALAVGFGERSGLRVRQRIDTDLPALEREAELAVYRVAQEAMTNVVRHARAERVELKLQRRDGAVVLTVRDDGCGIEPGHLRSATGVAGMRERALLVGGSLNVSGSPATGTDVQLRVPVT
jgi:two-component system sensor histidine kinase UhpB